MDKNQIEEKKRENLLNVLGVHIYESKINEIILKYINYEFWECNYCNFSIIYMYYKHRCPTCFSRKTKKCKCFSKIDVYLK